MPTGYTANVVDGKVEDFPTFALQCARQFGACIMLRDHSDDVLPTPENVTEASDYYTRSLAEQRARLAELQAMTPPQAKAAAEAAHAKALAIYHDSAERARVARERCTAMLSKVADWQPPTKDHEGLKEFMVSQLRETAEFDGKVYGTLPQQVPADVWRAQQIAACRETIARHEEEAKKEAERNRNRAEWVRTLRASLEPKQ